jgi:hypothetical protein
MWLSDELLYSDAVDSDEDAEPMHSREAGHLRERRSSRLSKRLDTAFSLKRVAVVLATIGSIGIFLVGALDYIPWFVGSLMAASTWLLVLFYNTRGSKMAPARYRLFFGGVTVLLIGLALLLGYVSSGLCVCLNPAQASTSLSRWLQGPSCVADSICHLYFTVANDLSQNIIVNTQLTTADLLGVNVTYTRVGGGDNSTLATTVASTCFRMSAITDESRWVCWADLLSLAPNTCYSVLAVPLLPPGVAVVSSAESQSQFCTAPVDTFTPISFVSGGDFQLGDDARSLGRQAALSKPLFAIVGGDVAYENAIIQCYRR